MARRSGIRASDSDRELVVDRLRGAAGEGRIASHELEERVGRALAARTYGDLDATVADLPGARSRGRAARALGTARSHPALLLAAIPVVLVAVAVMLALTLTWLVLMVVLFVLGRRHTMLLRRGEYVWGHVPGRERRRLPGHWV